MVFKYKRNSTNLLLLSYFLCCSYKGDEHTKFWNKEQTLTFYDFQLTTNKFKENAYVSVGVRSHYKVEHNLLILNTYSCLYKLESFININYKDSTTLLHEQCHFDINELHRRKAMMFLKNKFKHTTEHYKKIIKYADSITKAKIDNFDILLDDSTSNNKTYLVQKYFNKRINDSILFYKNYQSSVDSFNCKM